MVKIFDLVCALVSNIKSCIPESRHYIGKLPEGFKTPSFLYLLVYDGNIRITKYTKNVSLDFQIVYFHQVNAYGEADQEDKLRIIDNLKAFLDTYNLHVSDRNLKFEYDISESDEQLTLNIKFKFKDDVVQPKEVYDFMEHIKINGEEV